MSLKWISLLFCLVSWSPAQAAEDRPSPFPGKLGPIPADLHLEYGPEWGVTYSEIKDHKKNFDDTMYMGIAGAQHSYRKLVQIQCTYKSDSGSLNSLAMVYGYQKDLVFGKLRGYRYFYGRSTRHRIINIDNGHRLTAVALRRCDNVIQGLKFSVSGEEAVTCGNFTGSDDGCEYPILHPPKDHHVVGFYGDSNGVFNTKRRGVRGLGLITVMNS